MFSGVFSDLSSSVGYISDVFHLAVEDLLDIGVFLGGVPHVVGIEKIVDQLGIIRGGENVFLMLGVVGEGNAAIGDQAAVFPNVGRGWTGPVESLLKGQFSSPSALALLMHLSETGPADVSV